MVKENKDNIKQYCKTHKASTFGLCLALQKTKTPRKGQIRLITLIIIKLRKCKPFVDILKNLNQHQGDSNNFEQLLSNRILYILRREK